MIKEVLQYLVGMRKAEIYGENVQTYSDKEFSR